MDATIWVAIIGGLFGAGGVVAFLKVSADKRKILSDAKVGEATAEVTLGGGWQALWTATRAENDQQRKEINELRERVALVEKREHDCQARLAALEGNKTSHQDVEQVVARLLDQEIIKREEHVHHGVHVHAPDATTE